ncbi:MAG: ribonuclease H family protein [Bacteroidales bacterium]|nr:ribonuclease H family protein [Bacteroidales bacterium]
MAKKTKYYVVWKGENPGVYDSWDSCNKQVQGFDNALYKSFTNKDIAEKAYNEGPWNYIGNDKRVIEFSEEDKARIGMPNLNSISVDAACSGNPGILEYRGVNTKTGNELFRQGPFQQGTVNIGEFLALVHGLALLKQKNSNAPVYSDSKTAITWVRNKKVNTKLEKTTENKILFEMVDRALTWLRSNSYANPIIKWETAYWGEIPADFGRK